MGSNPTLSATVPSGRPDGGFYTLAAAPVAQLDRASGYGPEGRGFESLQARDDEAIEGFVEVIDSGPTSRLVTNTNPISINAEASSITVSKRWSSSRPNSDVKSITGASISKGPIADKHRLDHVTRL